MESFIGWVRGYGKTGCRLLACAGLVAGVAACGGSERSQYSEIGTSFSKGYQSAADLIKENLGTATRDARRLAVVDYVVNGNDVTNLDARDITASFRRYVCAGSGRYQNLRAALSVTEAYQKMISDLSTAPSDDLGKLWASIQKLQKPAKPLALPEPNPAAYADCLKSLAALVPPSGEKIEVPTKEAVTIAGLFAAYDAVTKLVDALKKVAVLALKQVDEAARAQAIRDYVLANQATVEQVIGHADAKGNVTEGILNGDALTAALERRKKSSLVVPYYTFEKMMRLDRGTARVDIMKLDGEAQAGLAEFDDLSRRKPPKDIVKAMREAPAQLVDLANGKMSAGDAWAAFTAFATAAKALNDAVKDAAQKAKDSRDALGKL